ncbi:MAG: winged helix-turn-helix transcriptional regulator [Solirubrobacterales bacterium]
MRTGERALSLLSAPLNVHILKALEEEERGLTDLTRAVGLPPASTMRSYLRSLVETGVLVRQREGGFPGGVSFALTPAGRGLLEVGKVLEQWLREAPELPISLGSTASKSATKALIDGWSANIVRALASRPMPLTKLDRLIPQVSYPTLERRLTAMRLVGLVEARRQGSGRGTPYSVTPWLRRAVATLVAAAAWESRYFAEAPVERLDVEASFLLAIPLLELPPGLTGTCRLTIAMKVGADPDHAGVTVAMEESRIASCVTRLDGEVDAWIAGSPTDWFCCMNGFEDSRIDFGGDVCVGRGMMASLRELLMPLPARVR